MNLKIYRMNTIYHNVFCKFALKFCLLFVILTFEILNGYAQSETENYKVIHGVVRNSHSKLPISAAQITVFSKMQTTTTDENGRFTLRIPFSISSIGVSAYGYNNRVASINGKDSVVVDLLPDVFTNYYISVETEKGLRSNIGVINSIKSSFISDKLSAFSLDELPQLFANADIRSVKRSGQMGQGNVMFLRGLNSINANVQPLYIVDGVVWDNLSDAQSIHYGNVVNSFANIDLDDIQSISVIKDGTSIYGSKGSNGVILITTKRATELATQITVSINTGVTTMPSGLPMMTSDDYKIYTAEQFGSKGYTLEQISKLAYLNEDPTRTTYKAYHNNTNWLNQVYQPALSQAYHIGVKGGDNKALYYFSLGYTKNNGVVKSSDLQRYNMRYNGDIKIAPNFDLAVNMGFSRIDRNLYDDGVNNYSSPTWIAMVKSPLISPYNYSYTGDLTTDYTYTDIFNIGNPMAVIAYSTNTVKQSSFNLSLKPKLILTKELSICNNFSYSLSKMNEDKYRPMLYTAPKYLDGIGYTYNSRSSQTVRGNLINNDMSLNFSKLIGIAEINAQIGNRISINDFESDFVEGYNSGSNSSINLVGGFSNLRTLGVNNVVRSVSNYFVGEYNYDNRYILNISAALDASTLFGNKTNTGIGLFNHDWGFFPSLNGAWIISSERFMKSIPVISLLKLRAGYGLTGNDNIQNYQNKAYLNGVRYSGVNNGLVISDLANPTLQWESTAKANVGMDLGLFNDRVTLSADFYHSYTSNLLVRKQYQDVVGLTNYWANDGELSNKGFEVSLNAKVLNLKNFQWETSASVGHYVNNVEKLSSGSFVNSVCEGDVITEVGNPVSVFYGYKTLGVFASDEEASQAHNGTGYLHMMTENGTVYQFKGGDIHFVDTDENGVIDKNDRQIIGDPNPKYYGAFTNKFTYKNLSLTALFTYSYGNQVYNYMRSQLEAGKDFNNQTIVMLNRWTSSNQETTQPRASWGDPVGNSRFSDRWIEDGSYIKLRTITLNYLLPVKVKFLESITVGLSANNIFTLTNYLGLDPETSISNSALYQGVDAGLLPSTRNYNVNLKINL